MKKSWSAAIPGSAEGHGNATTEGNTGRTEPASMSYLTRGHAREQYVTKSKKENDEPEKLCRHDPQAPSVSLSIFTPKPQAKFREVFMLTTTWQQLSKIANIVFWALMAISYMGIAAYFMWSYFR